MLAPALIILMTFSSFTFAGLIKRSEPYRPCEIALAKYINGNQFVTEFGTHRVNFWYEEFDANWMLSTFSEKSELIESIRMLKAFLNNDPIFNKNLENFINQAISQNKIMFSEVKAIFREKNINKTLISFASLEKGAKNSIRLKIADDPAALKAWLDINKSKKLSKFYQNEYQRILFSLDFTKEEFELLGKNYKPTGKIDDLKRFEDYMDFIKYRNIDYRLKAIADIKNIHTPIGNVSGTPATAFKEYKIKINEYRARREKFHFERHKKNNQGDVSEEKLLHAKLRAKHEASLYQKLLAGCKGNFKSPSLKSATRKFKNFKIASSLGFGMWGYTNANKDKLDPNLSNFDQLKIELGLGDGIKKVGDDYDAYWYRRLMYEIGSGLAFTWVNNLIITNPGMTAFKKGWSGYLKFSVMDGINAWGYDGAFAGDPKKVQEEFEKLRRDPNFQKRLEEILKEVYDKTSKNSVKKILDEHFNMSASTSKEDLEKITLEDLQSSEAQELIMELLAERMYLNSMGDIPLFQTGSTGTDRWFFYRLYNIPNTIKSVAVDLLIFRIMCMNSGSNSSKLDTAKAFLISLAIQLIDKRITTPILYEPRRKAINQ